MTHSSEIFHTFSFSYTPGSKPDMLKVADVMEEIITKDFSTFESVFKSVNAIISYNFGEPLNEKGYIENIRMLCEQVQKDLDADFFSGNFMRDHYDYSETASEATWCFTEGFDYDEQIDEKHRALKGVFAFDAAVQAMNAKSVKKI